MFKILGRVRVCACRSDLQRYDQVTMEPSHYFKYFISTETNFYGFIRRWDKTKNNNNRNTEKQFQYLVRAKKDKNSLPWILLREPFYCWPVRSTFRNTLCSVVFRRASSLQFSMQLFGLGDMRLVFNRYDYCIIGFGYCRKYPMLD